jgi:hypothetical protein
LARVTLVARAQQDVALVVLVAKAVLVDVEAVTESHVSA